MYLQTVEELKKLQLMGLYTVGEKYIQLSF
jgi:hypothetical protein